MYKRHYVLTALSLVAVAAVLTTQDMGAVPQSGQEVRRAAPSSFDAAENGIEVVRVRDNVYLLAGAGANITVEVHQAGVLLVDAGNAASASKVIASLRMITNKPVTAIISTHAHTDHTGGNDVISRTGFTLGAVTEAGANPNAQPRAAVIAHENVLNRLSSGPDETPVGMWPSDTFFNDVKVLTKTFYGDSIQILHQPRAHTDGDSFVFFRGADVISAGDIFVTTAYPHIDVTRGGSIQGELDALNNLLDLIVSDVRTEGGTLVIPGHGRISDIADVAYYRDMVTVVRDRVKAMIDKKMTLVQIQAAQPTFDYDPRYNTPAWTGAMFVEAVYRSLSSGTAAPPSGRGR